MSERIELQKDLTHNAHCRNIFIIRDIVKVLGSRGDKVHQSLRIIVKNGLSRCLEIFIAQHLRLIVPFLAYEISVLLQSTHRTMV